jgi:hypothetical protein
MTILKQPLWLVGILVTALLVVILFMTSDTLKRCISERNIGETLRSSQKSVPEVTRTMNVISENSLPIRDPIPFNSTGAVTIYNKDFPDSKMNPFNQNSAYFLSSAPISRISLTRVVNDDDKSPEIDQGGDTHPSGKYQLKRGGVLGKQLYSADGKFLRCLPLSINVERGDNPDAAEHCADNIQWNWLDDQRLIGVQPIDLKDAPDPFSDNEPEGEYTLPMPSSSRVYVLDLKKMEDIYEVGPLPELPPYYAIELTGITKDGLVLLQAVNYTDRTIPKSDRLIKLGIFRINMTPE